jgi:L-fuconolactonase
MLRIDAHQHFWNLERVAYPWLTEADGPIFRTFEPPELEPQLKAAGIDRTVLVQAMDSAEDTAYMLETADRYPWIGAVVGWVPLTDPDEAGRRLEALTRHPRLRGVRHLIHNEADPDWVVQERVIEGLKIVASFDLTFDVVAVFPNHLRHVPTLAERVPGLRLVIDHLAKPPIARGEMEPWASELARAAAYPQVYAKVSGLNTAADWATWSARDLRPYVDFALERFGADRLMFGSDWPVLTLAGNYARVWSETQAVLAAYTPAEREAILGGTAARFYRIEPAPESRTGV